ncbi:MAG: DUF4926 domain-containing protein [Phycisphaerae bacterium]|nr:DUF4926 domain-containing protein [Phycisphaerae bacterium]MDW8263306.1 hypothetical protein [Phycisphaerales bacterium]
MRLPAVDDTVRLRQDIPELSLTRGMSGVVRSMWCAPWKAYEVVFKVEGSPFDTRALLLADQVEVAEPEETRPGRGEWDDRSLA